jgi:putative flippase GtrA
MTLFNNSHYAFLVRYGVVGLSGGLIQTGVLYVWVDVLHFEQQYLLGAITGFCAALAVTFTLQKYWTFQDYTHTEVRKQFVTYTLIALATLGLNILLLQVCKSVLEHFGVNFFHIWYLVTQVVIIGILAGLSYLANYFITFRARP